MQSLQLNMVDRLEIMKAGFMAIRFWYILCASEGFDLSVVLEERGHGGASYVVPLPSVMVHIHGNLASVFSEHSVGQDPQVGDHCVT